MRSFYEFRLSLLATFQMNIGIEPESGHIHGEVDAIGNIFRLRSTEMAIRSYSTVKPRLSTSSDVRGTPIFICNITIAMSYDLCFCVDVVSVLVWFTIFDFLALVCAIMAIIWN